jgi:murein DD-endopeptidase MepM/ murein hydrolase activator NlpD
VDQTWLNVVKTQRREGNAHHKFMTRKLFASVTAAAFLVIALLNWTMISRGVEYVGDKLLLYVRIARLYTREPDQNLSMPVKGALRKQVANTWHAPRGVERRHEGQDIFGLRGTPVMSATEGYVVNIGENPLGGNTVSVIGDGGRVYYYAHLDSYAHDLEEGDHVTRRTLLGYVGTTGNAQGTPPHLHFGVYGASGAIDPLPLLSDRTDSGRKSE